jgi:phospho-N-acetylmuramoyl-pentapeptide-transferase
LGHPPFSVVCRPYHGRPVHGFFPDRTVSPENVRFPPEGSGPRIYRNAEAAVGKPTGAGSVFVSIFVVISLLIVPLNLTQIAILILTWITMLSGFLDDRATDHGASISRERSISPYPYAAALAIMFLYYQGSPTMWLPFTSATFAVHPLLYCRRIDHYPVGLREHDHCTTASTAFPEPSSSSRCSPLGIIFYFVLGHTRVSQYLLLPHIADGAQWAVIIFALSGILMGYLWHNAFPSKVLMGDADHARSVSSSASASLFRKPVPHPDDERRHAHQRGNRDSSRSPAPLLQHQILHTIRFPLHDHMRKNLSWSPTQVLLKFMIVQILITLAVFGVFFKIR